MTGPNAESSAENFEIGPANVDELSVLPGLKRRAASWFPPRSMRVLVSLKWIPALSGRTWGDAGAMKRGRDSIFRIDA